MCHQWPLKSTQNISLLAIRKSLGGAIKSGWSGRALDSCPPYDALSYCWGANEKTSEELPAMIPFFL